MQFWGVPHNWGRMTEQEMLAIAIQTDRDVQEGDQELVHDFAKHGASSSLNDVVEVKTEKDNLTRLDNRIGEF